MKVISIINLKGGVGKTFTSIQLAAMMNYQNKNVLMIDNDKQGNLSKFYQVYNEYGEIGTAKLLKYDIDIGDIISKTLYKKIDVIPANMNLLAAVALISQEQTSSQYMKYKNMLSELKKEGFYDYVIIDNPPDISINVINALIASDEVIVPIKIDDWSLDGMRIITEQIKEAQKINSRIKLLGLLVTMYRTNDTNLTGVEYLEAYKYPIFKTKIRYSEKSDESIFFHKPIFEYSSRSGAAQDYKKFYKEFLEKAGE